MQAHDAHDEGGNGRLLAVLDERTKEIQKALASIQITVEAKYVTKDEFGPVRMLVYGLAGTVLSGVLVGIMTLVLRK